LFRRALLLLFCARLSIETFGKTVAHAMTLLNQTFVSWDSIPLSRTSSGYRKGANVGAVIMLGTLFGLIILIFGVVQHFDPEARRAPSHEGDR
jgi:hypothetical protein